MKGFKGLMSLVVLSALTLSISAPVLADEQTQTAGKAGGDDAVKFNELVPGHDRGLMLAPIIPTMKPVQPVVKPVTAKPAPTATKASLPKLPAKPVTIAKPQPKKVQAAAPVTAIKPAKSPTPVKPVSSDEPKGQPTSNTETQGQGQEPEVITVSHHHSAQAANNVVTAWLDKSGNMPKYKVGDKLVVNITASTDCNVVVFNYDAKGTLTQIFPNDYQPSNLVRSGECVQIGGPDSPFEYEISGKGGTERIFVYAYPSASEQPLTVAMAPIPHTPFRSAEMTIEQYRDLVNRSKVFFSREVKVVPRRGPAAQPVSAATSSPTGGGTSGAPAAQPNKVELTFQVEGK